MMLPIKNTGKVPCRRPRLIIQININIQLEISISIVFTCCIFCKLRKVRCRTNDVRVGLTSVSTAICSACIDSRICSVPNAYSPTIDIRRIEVRKVQRIGICRAGSSKVHKYICPHILLGRYVVDGYRLEWSARCGGDVCVESDIQHAARTVGRGKEVGRLVDVLAVSTGCCTEIGYLKISIPVNAAGVVSHRIIQHIERVGHVGVGCRQFGVARHLGIALDVDLRHRTLHDNGVRQRFVGSRNGCRSTECLTLVIGSKRFLQSHSLEVGGIEELAATACIGDVLRPEQAGIGHAQRKRHIESTCFYSLRISGQNASARIEHLQDVLQLVSCH